MRTDDPDPRVVTCTPIRSRVPPRAEKYGLAY
jgi:hypothetical protein